MTFPKLHPHVVAARLCAESYESEKNFIETVEVVFGGSVNRYESGSDVLYAVWVPNMETTFMVVVGTNDLMDVLSDIDVGHKRTTLSSMQGWVHAGFWSAANQLLGVTYDKWHRGKIVYTGHSRGGAVATIMAVQARGYGRRVKVVTFGAPRFAGNKYMLEFLPPRVDLTAYVGDGDIVPRVPLRGCGYAQSGRVGISEDGTTRYIPDLGRTHWLLGILEAVVLLVPALVPKRLVRGLWWNHSSRAYLRRLFKAQASLKP